MQQRPRLRAWQSGRPRHPCQSAAGRCAMWQVGGMCVGRMLLCRSWCVWFASVLFAVLGATLAAHVLTCWPSILPPAHPAGTLSMGGPGERARARQLLEQAVLLKQQYAGAPDHPGALVGLGQAVVWATH